MPSVMTWDRSTTRRRPASRLVLDRDTLPGRAEQDLVAFVVGADPEPARPAAPFGEAEPAEEPGQTRVVLDRPGPPAPVPRRRGQSQQLRPSVAPPSPARERSGSTSSNSIRPVCSRLPRPGRSRPTPISRRLRLAATATTRPVRSLSTSAAARPATSMRDTGGGKPTGAPVSASVLPEASPGQPRTRCPTPRSPPGPTRSTVMPVALGGAVHAQSPGRSKKCRPRGVDRSGVAGRRVTGSGTTARSRGRRTPANRSRAPG